MGRDSRHRLNLSLSREEMEALRRVKTQRGLSSVSLCQFVKGLALALCGRLDTRDAETEESIDAMFAEYEEEEGFTYERQHK